ncbi:HCP-like protein [Neocallimastix lanati (nom. inval.)]|uniref:HCP-like protein n=1 Tax=Neocallimastix californiae TaxID=1754190 RepID=A0A1Y2ELE9_9FUNG|nr:HCP-like protein [Neocallimastix sp. JGI-2020a]ORY72369.1 HCP-like protein [Neocallimastix californiae]|eukprot:ORY72369.1 HCP-like protein [Neocallimastix californiae]
MNGRLTNSKFTYIEEDGKQIIILDEKYYNNEIEKDVSNIYSSENDKEEKAYSNSSLQNIPSSENSENFKYSKIEYKIKNNKLNKNESKKEEEEVNTFIKNNILNSSPSIEKDYKDNSININDIEIFYHEDGTKSSNNNKKLNDKNMVSIDDHKNYQSKLSIQSSTSNSKSLINKNENKSTLNKSKSNNILKTPRKKVLNRSSIIKISPKTKVDHNTYNSKRKSSVINSYREWNEYNEIDENSTNVLSPFTDKEKAYRYYIDSAFNGDVNSQKAVARCCMFGIGTDKNYRKACQFLKAAAHQKDIESMVILAEGYGNGMFPLQEELSDEEDYFDNEISSESEDSIRFSSSSSFSSDDSYLSDDFNSDKDSYLNNNNSSNQLVPNLDKLPSPSKTNFQNHLSSNKPQTSFLHPHKNILVTPTKSPTNNKTLSTPNIKKVYRKKVSLLNTFNGMNSSNNQKINNAVRDRIKERRKNKFLSKKRKFSFHYRKMAAKYGHLSSIKFIAKAYDYGLDELNITHNSHLAQKYYTIAAKEYEDVDSLRRLGDMYYYHDDNKSNNKYKTISFNYYQKAAMLGDLKSSAKVAHCLYYGEGVPQNIQNAYKLLLEIAESNSDGQLMKFIGDEYFYGSDSTVSISNKKNNSKEQSDNKIKPDISLALDYYYKAIRMKDASACKTVGNHYFLGIPKHLKSDPKKAVEYYEQAVNLGDYSVIKLIADCYLFGIGVKRNVDKAKKLYDKLKEEGLWEGEMPSPDAEVDLDF